MSEMNLNMEGKEVVVKDTKFFIPEWNMRKQMANAKFVIPLVIDPMSNAVAVSGDDDENLYGAALIRGVGSAIAESDLEVVIPKLLDGVTYISDKGVPDMATLDKLEKAGFNFFDLMKICLEVLKVNVGPLFNGDFQGMMGSL
jgi:hypothetical protein